MLLRPSPRRPGVSRSGSCPGTPWRWARTPGPRWRRSCGRGRRWPSYYLSAVHLPWIPTICTSAFFAPGSPAPTRTRGARRRRAGPRRRCCCRSAAWRRPWKLRGAWRSERRWAPKGSPLPRVAWGSCSARRAAEYAEGVRSQEATCSRRVSGICNSASACWSRAGTSRGRGWPSSTARWSGRTRWAASLASTTTSRRSSSGLRGRHQQVVLRVLPTAASWLRATV
mmetsp:Transcript_39316/g.113507  ORF Transcript_39316/g.113507 Transcript_39316/m.113507 type:complete len:226 (+) Transcript_39316:882-1559(+)